MTIVMLIAKYVYTQPTVSIGMSFLVATYDVRSAIAKIMGSEIEITVQFISNSHAMGCFVVLQSENGSHDVFRILLRSGSKLDVTSVIGAPPANYIMYVYDLEEDGDINNMPAILVEEGVHVTTECRLTEMCMHYHNHLQGLAYCMCKQGYVYGTLFALKLCLCHVV